MKNNVLVYSRSSFKHLISVLTPDEISRSAFISIHEPLRGTQVFEDCSSVILESAPNVLNLWFDDAEEDFELLDGLKCVLFDEHMAKQIHEFVDRYKEGKQFFFHCTAGISRSGAVGETVAEYLGIDYFEFKLENPKVKPNTLVKTLLRNQFYGNNKERSH